MWCGYLREKQKVTSSEAPIAMRRLSFVTGSQAGRLLHGGHLLPTFLVLHICLGQVLVHNALQKNTTSDHSEDKQDLLKIWGESKTTSNIEQLQWRNVSQVDLLQLLHPWCSPQISYCCPHPAWKRGGLFVSDLTGRLYTKKCCACKLHDPLSISSIQCTHCLRCFQSFFYL